MVQLHFNYLHNICQYEKVKVSIQVIIQESSVGGESVIVQIVCPGPVGESQIPVVNKELILGMIPPDIGDVIIQKGLRMGYLPQEASIFRKLTVRQNILAILETLDLSKADLVVLDEAYREFVTDPRVHDATALLGRYPNLVVTRTFSKAHGLAALRVGYAVSSPEIAELLGDEATSLLEHTCTGITQDQLNPVLSKIFGRKSGNIFIDHGGHDLPRSVGIENT